MFETETVGPCLVQKLKCGTMAPLPPPPTQWQCPCNFQFWFSPTANYNRCVRSRPVKSCSATESLPVIIDFFRYPVLCRVFLPVFAAVSFESISDPKIILSTLQNIFFWRIRGLCSFTIHDPTTNDSWHNDSRFMHKLSLSLHAMNILGEGSSFHRIENFNLNWTEFDFF